MVLLYSLVVFIYAVLFLSGTLGKKAVAAVLFLCVIIMDSSLCVNLVSSLMQSPASEIYAESDLTRLITLIFVQCLNLLVFQILEKAICIGSLRLKMREWMLLGGVFSLSIICMTLIQIAAIHMQSDRKIRLCFLGADLAIILVDYITIRFITALHRQHLTELENTQMKTQLQYQTQYADTVRQQEESVHRLRHDFKTTISAMCDFLNNNQLEEMRQFLDAYSASLNQAAPIMRTNQMFLNAILNTKLTFAKENGIVCSCHSPQQLPAIDGVDYCSLLGNLLDNAIESSLQSPVREIVVTLDYIKPKLTVMVKNKMQGSILESNPQLCTTKAKGSGHGYGITAIREIAEKYHGSADFYEMDGWFVAVVMLYTE